MFTTPITHNYPIEEPRPFYVGFSKPPAPFPKIVSSNGPQRLRKPQLRYDGVYSAQSHLCSHTQTQKTNWNPHGKKTEGYYGGKLFHLPERACRGVVVSPPDCDWNTRLSDYPGATATYASARNRNAPTMPNKPSFEDLWGYVPQDNRLTYIPIPRWPCVPYNFVPE